jgi:hypothetical protein
VPATANSRKNKNSNNGARAHDDDEEQDGDDEPVADDELYCFCNQGSYGEMVACDGEGCPREWFHLECVGLKVAPKRDGKFLFSPLLLFLLSPFGCECKMEDANSC